MNANSTSKGRPKASLVSGATWIVLAQAFLGVAQFAYGAVTGRLFSPSQFGGFVAGLSLFGLTNILASTGITSYVLSRQVLATKSRRFVRMYAWIAGCISGLLFFAVSPLWFAMLDSSGSWPVFAGILSLASVVSPYGSVESAIMRRSRDGRRDALILVIAFLLSSLIGVATMLLTRAAWSLAVSMAVGPLITGLVSRVSQVAESEVRLLTPGRRSMINHVLSSTGHGVGNYFIQSSPTWAAGLVGGSSGLGYFSRAQTLAGAPGTALATGINRALQPAWPRLASRPGVADRLLLDVFAICSFGSSILFGGLTVLAPPLVDLWLGPGWHSVVPQAQLMCFGYFVHISYAILSSNAEMLGRHSVIRQSQIAGASVIVAVLIAAVLLQNLNLVALSVGIGYLVAVLILLGFRTWRAMRYRRSALQVVTRTCIIFLVTTLLSEWCSELIARDLGTIASLGVRTLVYVTISTASLRLYGVGPVLRRRGLPAPRLLL